jgi:hypothetical protein
MEYGILLMEVYIGHKATNLKINFRKYNYKFRAKIENSNSLKSRFGKFCYSLFTIFSNKILELLLQNEAIYKDYLFQKKDRI